MQIDAIGPERGHHTRLLHPPDLPALQALFERATDYFEIATGAPPAKDEAGRAFVAGPPAKAVDDKCTVGIFHPDGSLAGVLDALVDWPEDGTWTLGMLLLEPGSRGAGLGSDVLSAFEAWGRSRGAGRIRTAVVAHHPRGIGFLEARGYVRETSVEGYDAGARRATIVFLSKSLPPHGS